MQYGTWLWMYDKPRTSFTKLEWQATHKWPLRIRKWQRIGADNMVKFSRDVRDRLVDAMDAVADGKMDSTDVSSLCKLADSISKQDAVHLNMAKFIYEHELHALPAMTKLLGKETPNGKASQPS